jgi:hypothetical protein
MRGCVKKLLSASRVGIVDSAEPALKSFARTELRAAILARRIASSRFRLQRAGATSPLVSAEDLTDLEIAAEDRPGTGVAQSGIARLDVTGGLESSDWCRS